MKPLLEIGAEKIEVPEDLDEALEVYYERGWTDGLPVILPTEERVERMLKGTKRDPAQSLGPFPPGGNEATVGLIAINAVMAGCLPDYMPILLTAVNAMLEEEFNLHWIQATTHPVAPLVIINGPIRNRLGINYGHNLFGQGNRANATIGRAIRLILLNIGGALPGYSDMATQGQPSKYSFCIGENEESSPWEPLHAERGFERSASTITICGVENPHNINDHTGGDGEHLLTTIAGTMATQGNNNILYQGGEPLVVIGPEHAALIAKSGFSKEKVKHFLHEKARIAKKSFSKRHQEEHFSKFADDDLIPLVPKEEDLMIIVAGGAGKHSAYCPSFGFTRSVTKEITS